MAIDIAARSWFTWGMTKREETRERLLNALTEIEEAAQGTVKRNQQLQERARYLREQLEAGNDLVTLVEREERPRMVELLSANKVVLETAGAEFRAAEALALRAEGLTIEAIAGLFGVTRQRISALLKQPAAKQR